MVLDEEEDVVSARKDVEKVTGVKKTSYHLDADSCVLRSSFPQIGCKSHSEEIGGCSGMGLENVQWAGQLGGEISEREEEMLLPINDVDALIQHWL